MTKPDIVLLIEQIIKDKIEENTIKFQNFEQQDLYFPDKDSIDPVVVYEIVDTEGFNIWKEFFVLATFSLKSNDTNKASLNKSALLNIRFAEEKHKEALEKLDLDPVQVDVSFYDDWQPAIEQLDAHYSFNSMGLKIGFKSHYDTIDFKDHLGDAETRTKEIT